MAIRLSWSQEPFSRCRIFNCLPASMHILVTCSSKVNLSSISIPNTFIVSDDGRETFLTVTFTILFSFLPLLYINMVWNFSGFAANEFKCCCICTIVCADDLAPIENRASTHIILINGGPAYIRDRHVVG